MTVNPHSGDGSGHASPLSPGGHVFGERVPRDDSARNVVWHGRVPRDRLLGELLPTMDLSVLPTREDTLVLALVEAQGVGVPVVASRLAGIATDVVKDGETGILCNINDDGAFIAAVEKLMGDAAMRRTMGEAARRFVAAEWDADRWYDRHLDALVALADGKAPGHAR
jgi:glycosyltransferase involved in cell wall biosynthesis